MFFIKLFAGRERNFARDFLKAGFAIIFLATVGTNLIAYHFSSGESEIQTIRVTDAKTRETGVRNYTEVRSVLDGEGGASQAPRISQRSVLDDDIVTGTAKSKLNRIQLDPCQRVQPE